MRERAKERERERERERDRTRARERRMDDLLPQFLLALLERSDLLLRSAFPQGNRTCGYLLAATNTLLRLYFGSISALLMLY